MNNQGIIEAKSIGEKNGIISLEGGSAGTVSVSGILDTSGETDGETGGTIKILGEQIILTNSAYLDASGQAAGGIVLVGGDYQGEGAEQNAKTLRMEQTAAITADALTQGNGGKVILWSDQDTKFYGKISVCGGHEGGNGGFIETSGGSLDAQGRVDAGAIRGESGQ